MKKHPTKKCRKKTSKKAEPPATEIPRPHWVPLGTSWESLPADLQTALLEIVTPAYEQLVLHVSDSLEKSTGMTLVLLLWQELINQHQLGEEYIPDRFVRVLGGYPTTLNRQLELAEAKTKAGYVLLRIRESLRLVQRFTSPPATTRLDRPLPADDHSPLMLESLIPNSQPPDSPPNRANETFVTQP